MAARSFYVADRVMTSSTTTGTGDMTLSGTPVDGYEAFSMPGGAFVEYAIVAVDAVGAPTGDYEVGLGKDNSGSLSRIRVYRSTNGGGKVDWPVGTKYVSVVVPAHSAGSIKRSPGTDEENFYVSTSGDDLAEGIDPSIGSVVPVATLGAAFERINEYSFPPGFTVTVNIGAGTFSTGDFAFRVRADGPDAINIVGASSSTTTISGLDVSGDKPCAWTVGDLTVSNGVVARSGQSVTVESTAVVNGGDNHLSSLGADSSITASSGVTLTGDSNSCFVAYDGGRVYILGDVDFPSNVTLATAFAYAGNYGVLFGGDFVKTGTGTITGKRYDASFGGIVSTSGGGATFFPGTVSGTTAVGGVYE